MENKSTAPKAEQIRNGDFSAGGTDWQSYNDVNYDDQRCNLGPGGQAVQTLLPVPAGRYRLSCRAALVDRGVGTTARLRLQVNGGRPTASGGADTPKRGFDSIIDITSTTEEVYAGAVNLTDDDNDAVLYLEGNSSSAWIDDVSFDLAPEDEELIQNGDFSQGSAFWDSTGALFDNQTCALRADDISQTVAISTAGYYMLKARARAGAGSEGRIVIARLPSGESQYSVVLANSWQDIEIAADALSGETGFKVSLIRDQGNDIEFDDISLKLFSKQ